jgi:hypothetical protein
MAKLTASITNAARSVKGLQKTWVFNRADFTQTKTGNVLSALTAIGGAKAFLASGCKDFNNAGHEAAVFENLCTAYKAKWALSVTEAEGTIQQKADARKNIDQAEDIFIIVKTSDGTLLAFGLEYGLWKTSQSQMANDNNALTAVEFGTREQMEETYSQYYVTISEATLNGLL